MGKPVTWDDIDLSQNGTQTVSTTSLELLPTRLNRTRRTQFIISNTSATTVTIVKGNAATANKGIRLQQNQSYIESDDAGYRCWQGPIAAVASASSTVVYSETIER